MFANNNRLFLLDEQTLINHRDRNNTLNTGKLEAYHFEIFNFQDKIKEDTTSTNLFAINSKNQVLMGNTSGQIIFFDYADLFKNRIECS